MAWIRLEDTFPEHRKIDAAGGDAAWLHVCGIGYCNRNRTDGFIPAERVPRLSDRKGPMKLADKLVDVGLWEATDGGYLVHDYLDYNPTRAEVEKGEAERSRIKSEAGKLGGIASGIARRKHSTKQTGSTPEPNGQANGNQNEAPSHPVPSRPDQEPPAAEESSSAVTPAATDDDVAKAALDMLADQWTRRFATDGRGTQYRAKIITNGHDHLPRLTELANERPGATPVNVAAAYEAGGWPQAINPDRADHPTTCDCGSTGWIATADGAHVERCTTTDWPEATIHQLRGAS